MLTMHHEDRAKHDHSDAKRGEPREKSGEEGERSEEFAENHEQPDDPWEAAAGKQAECFGEAFPAEKAKRLLRAMWKENGAENHAHDEE